MRVFKTRWFSKWAKKAKLADDALWKTAKEMDGGLLETDLGGHVYKKRVALPGRGKRGGSRIIIAYQLERMAFYMYGFAKNQRTNIDDNELKMFKAVAKELLAHEDDMLDHLVKVEELIEVLGDE